MGGVCLIEVSFTLNTGCVEARTTAMNGDTLRLTSDDKPLQWRTKARSGWSVEACWVVHSRSRVAHVDKGLVPLYDKTKTGYAARQAYFGRSGVRHFDLPLLIF